MKKIDLHIHTVANKYLDYNFSYNSEFMKEYVISNELNVIAITNHNLFDKDNFIKVKTDLSSTDVLVLPGIEISLEMGHILVIGEDSETTFVLLENITQFISTSEQSDQYKMTIDDFNRLCCNKNFILIPHLKKTPSISDDVIKKIEEKIKIGEVSSPKHFYTQKKVSDISPVLFSDIRIGANDNMEYCKLTNRFTYVNCDEINFSIIKNSLSESRYVDLNVYGLDGEFDILNGKARACTGINVLLGNRSSGKTYTLNDIFNKNKETALYIKQFEITTECSDEAFLDKLKNIEQNFVINYMYEFTEIMNFIDLIDVSTCYTQLEEYISSLKENASQSISDLYSKMHLFNYVPIQPKSVDEIKNIIKAIDILLSASIEYKKDIEESIDTKKLETLFNLMVQKCKSLFKENLEINYTNSILKLISKSLGIKSSVVQIQNVDLSEIFKLRYIRYKFNKLIEKFNEDVIYNEEILSKFNKCIRIYKNTNKTKLKSILGVSRDSKVDYLVDKEPFEAYIESKNDTNIKHGSGDNRFKLFFDYEVTVKNSNNADLSGGQRAEFVLLDKLFKYQLYDIVLIDEMEASFDNPFLNEKIIDLIKDISKKCIVFISTHNNNLGVSLLPDYYIYHYVDTNKDIRYLHYCGKSNGTKLINEDSNEIELSSVLINTMEANKKTYEERRKKYENSNDKK